MGENPSSPEILALLQRLTRLSMRLMNMEKVALRRWRSESHLLSSFSIASFTCIDNSHDEGVPVKQTSTAQGAAHPRVISCPPSASHHSPASMEAPMKLKGPVTLRSIAHGNNSTAMHDIPIEWQESTHTQDANGVDSSHSKLLCGRMMQRGNTPC